MSGALFPQGQMYWDRFAFFFSPAVGDALLLSVTEFYRFTGAGVIEGPPSRVRLRGGRGAHSRGPRPASVRRIHPAYLCPYPAPVHPTPQALAEVNDVVVAYGWTRARPETVSKSCSTKGRANVWLGKDQPAPGPGPVPGLLSV